MKKSRSDKIEFVEGILDFCHTDLESLSPPEKTLLTRNLLGFFGLPDPGQFWNSDESDLVPEPVQAWKPLKDEQSQILNDLDWIYDKIKRKTGIGIRVKIPYSFSQYRDKFMFSPEYLLGFGEVIEASAIGTKDSLERRELHPASVRFLECLVDFPCISLSRCPHCKRIFFNPTKRKKTYCSQSCQNFAGVQRYRKKKEKQGRS